MFKPCDFCLDEICQGKQNCDCATCGKANDCPRYLHPTIRITTRCTQSCSHCCFSCSPKRSDFMSRDTAADVAQFLKNNDISTITIMGGEFFCHPDWESVLEIIISESNAKYVRLVTNGDWAAQKSNETLNAIEPYKDFLKISISEDQWHTNENVTAAADACEKRKFIWNFPTEEQRSVNSIVPVGRGDTYSFSFSAMFSCYCDDPRHKYSFLIDEMGDIFKCAMGVWRYTDVLENLNGGFTQMFRDYNTRFYKNFRPNCKSCYMAYLHRQRQKQE